MKPKRGFYVYVYIDPETGRPFYVGKGQGNRARKHLRNLQDSKGEKGETIKRLLGKGLQPRIDIVQWGLTEDEALAAEAALIQMIGLDQLTNRQSGRGTYKLHADFLEFIRDKKPLQLSPRMKNEMLVLCANKCYRPGMSRFELYDAVRGNLDVDPDRVKGCRFVLVVLWQFVIDVYENPACIPAGREPRAFARDDPLGAYDLVASFSSIGWHNRFAGRKLDVRYSFNSFAYARIQIPRGRH